MRTKADFFGFKEITIICQYLYLGEKIAFNNGLTDLEISMTDDFQITCKNLNFSNIEASNFTETFTIPYILGVVDILKGTPAVRFPGAFKNRWEEIKNIVSIQCGLNLDKYSNSNIILK